MNLRSTLLVGASSLTAVAMVATGVTSSSQEERISGFSTSLEGRTGGQRHNAVQAAAKLNGKTIEPGHTFSFNECVGTWSRDEGYRKAPVAFNGQLIPAWGGGVCQASTTLYNAALLAGLPIVERHAHMFAPSYVRPGRDAAVAFSNIDLKFKNSLSVPIKVKSFVQNSKLIVELWSKQSVEPVELIERTTLLQFPKTVSATMPSPSPIVRNSGRPGVNVVVYRKRGSQLELVSKDSYPVMHRVVIHRQ